MRRRDAIQGQGNGIPVLNVLGTTDAGYRGEIAVCLLNRDQAKAVDFSRGDRIAQLVIQRIEIASFQRVETLTEYAAPAGSAPQTGSPPAKSARGETWGRARIVCGSGPGATRRAWPVPLQGP